MRGLKDLAVEGAREGRRGVFLSWEGLVRLSSGVQMAGDRKAG